MLAGQTASALTMMSQFSVAGKVRCHNGAVDFARAARVMEIAG
jgi:hypothetical protein